MFTALNASFSTWADAARITRQTPQTWVHGDVRGWNHPFNSEDGCHVIDF